MTCEACKAKDGRYNFSCFGCCVRLVNSTKPLREKASGMLAVIARFNGAPSREEILKGLK